VGYFLLFLLVVARPTVASIYNDWKNTTAIIIGDLLCIATLLPLSIFSLWSYDQLIKMMQYGGLRRKIGKIQLMELMLQVTVWSRIILTCTNDIITKPSILWLVYITSYFVLTEFIPFIVILLWVNHRQKSQTQPVNTDNQVITESIDNTSDNMSNYNGQSKSRTSGMGDHYQADSDFGDNLPGFGKRNSMDRFGSDVSPPMTHEDEFMYDQGDSPYQEEEEEDDD
jgi:hypothetical protein